MLGEEGLVDEAAVLAEKLEELKREKDTLSRVRFFVLLFFGLLFSIER